MTACRAFALKVMFERQHSLVILNHLIFAFRVYKTINQQEDKNHCESTNGGIRMQKQQLNKLQRLLARAPVFLLLALVFFIV